MKQDIKEEFTECKFRCRSNVLLQLFQVSNTNESTTIPVRMEFTFYGKKPASHDEQPSEKKKDSERHADHLPRTDLEFSGLRDVPYFTTRGQESRFDTDEAAKRQRASEIPHHISNDHDGIQDVTDSVVNKQGAFDIESVVNEAHGEQTEIESVSVSDNGPAENASFSKKDHKVSGLVAQLTTNDPQETLSTTESKESQVTGSSFASTTEEDPDAQSQSTLTTAEGTTAASTERLKVGQSKKNSRRGKKKKGKKKKKPKKGDKASKPVENEEEGIETVFDSAVFHIDDDVKRKDDGDARKGKPTPDKVKLRKPLRGSESEQRTTTDTVEDSNVSPYYMFERRSRHARAHFPNLKAYLMNRELERRRELCRKKASLRGAVLITDICASAFNSQATAEIEEVDEMETKEPESPPDESTQIIAVDEKISLSKKEHRVTVGGRRSTQTEQNENPKAVEEQLIHSENQQHDIDNENTVHNTDTNIPREDEERARHSEKIITEQTENTVEHERSVSRKTTRRSNYVSVSDESVRRGTEHTMLEKRKESSVPTRVAIGPLGRSLTTWIINDPTKWRTKPNEAEVETIPTSLCGIETTTSDFAFVTEYPADSGHNSEDNDLTDDTTHILDVRASTEPADPKRKESAKKSLQQQPPRRSRLSSDYARKSKAVLEQLQRRSTKKAEKVKEEKQTEAKKQPQKKKGAAKEEPPPTIKVERLRRSQVNEWDVDEEFLRQLLSATDRFEVRKECITFQRDTTQTLQFVTFTRPFRSTYCHNTYCHNTYCHDTYC